MPLYPWGMWSKTPSGYLKLIVLTPEMKWKLLSHVWLSVTTGLSVYGILKARILVVGSCSLFQEIFPTQGLNPGLPHYRRILYQLSHQGSLRILEKTEHWRIDAFELWCWRRLLRVPWTARRSNQSILKEISPGCSLEGDQSWVSIGRTDAEAEIPVLWPPHANSWLIGKNPHAGKDWGREKGMAEDEMAGWHHTLNGHGFE